MYYFWVKLIFIIVFVSAKPDKDKESCRPRCLGDAYECVNGNCVCIDGYITDYHLNTCIKCPGTANSQKLGEPCLRECCKGFGNESLQCWHGVCRQCIDSHGIWLCRDPVDNIILVSTTQVIMGAAVILGIMATFVMILRLCTYSSLRPLGRAPNYESRLSVGSLQMYVDERLRNAPPRYSNIPPSISAVPTSAFTNEGFVQDLRMHPPPPYSEAIKTENNVILNTTLHI